jgi:prepilin-type N-terminal cleavage/methylation domain-containing protein
MNRLGSKTRTWFSRKQGVTFIELLVVIVVAGLLGSAILGVYEGVVRSWANTSNRIINQDDARLAINEIGRYLRMAQSSESNLSSTSDAIAAAQPQELVFYSDINGDGLADKCRFYLSGQSLRLATVAPNTGTSPPTYPTTYSGDGAVVLNGIQNGSTAIFTYYKLNPAYITNPIPANDTLVTAGNPTSATDLAKILAVGISLYINEVPQLSKGNVALDTLIQIRQRYDGGLSGS